ncbi:CAP domain-containing protein [Natronincola ferrireducens]|uniref:Uncharacterized protein, YkwD family n=1 Tax=Natronincola ferrireducens TaxID=393762 RepID=A0A1G9CQT7_9FIRM|nr:CAP domain-containing protein [Natronincola ferrireducens]SDK54022.1 uncharacterized protein, YkwD family [Natronincola ferrireducens]
MDNRLKKKLMVPVITTALLLSTVVSASAYSENTGIENIRLSCNIQATTTFSNGSTSSFSRFLQTFKNNGSNPIRITFKNDTAQPENTEQQEVPQEPQQQPQEPQQQPQEPQQQPQEPQQQPQEPQQQPQEPQQQPQEPQQQPQEPQQQPQPVKPENPSNARHALTSAEIQMVEYVNQARTEAGLNPLTIDVDLSYVARVKSKDMQDNNYFSHHSPTYGSPFDMMRSFGIQYKAAGENIAINSSVRGAHNAFMNSEGHRNNILNPRFTHIGIGIENRHYTQMFITK